MGNLLFAVWLLGQHLHCCYGLNAMEHKEIIVVAI